MSQKIYLLPTYLDESNSGKVIAPIVQEVIGELNYFIVEDIRTARRFISSLKLGLDISSLHFEKLDKRSDYLEVLKTFESFNGEDIGLLSEAGLPGLADPGNQESGGTLPLTKS